MVTIHDATLHSMKKPTQPFPTPHVRNPTSEAPINAYPLIFTACSTKLFLFRSSSAAKPNMKPLWGMAANTNVSSPRSSSGKCFKTEAWVEIASKRKFRSWLRREFQTWRIFHHKRMDGEDQPEFYPMASYTSFKLLLQKWDERAALATNDLIQVWNRVKSEGDGGGYVASSTSDVYISLDATQISSSTRQGKQLP